MAKKILSLDGGGVRGVATVEFLKMLEADQKKPIFDCFDMFAGTSTGGIIAAAIGVLKYTAVQVCDLYDYDNLNKIMNKSFWDKRLGLIQNEPKYDGKGKKDVLNHYFMDRFFIADKPVLLAAYDVEKRRIKVFKSDDATMCLAKQVVDASSAAPCFFPTVEVNDKWYIDGGVVVNNPTMCAYAEAKRMWPNEEIKVLSVGTGKVTRKINGSKSRKYGAVEWMTHDLLGIVMDETAVDYQAKQILGDNYVRVNSKLEEANDDMDDCSKGNIKNLKRLGRQWFAYNGIIVSNLLD